MPRRTTDLFEVFQPRQDGGASSGRGRKGSRKKGPRRDSKKRGTFEGIFLNPRQVLLTSCVLALLVVLAFTVGLGVGRGGGGTGPSLSRSDAAPDSSAWYVRGKMPRYDVLTGRPVDPDSVHEDLVRDHRFRASDIRIVEGARDHYQVFYGPFRTEAQARGVLERRKLGVLPVQGFHPFAFAEIVREDR